VDRASLRYAEPKLPATPAVARRQVFEVAPGADAAAIQKAVDEACAVKDGKAVVHFAPGRYSVNRTIVIPAEHEVTLLGDAIGEATQIGWTDGRSGPVLRLKGPSHASLEHLGIGGGKSVGVVVEVADQPGGYIGMDGVVAAGAEYGVVIDGLDETLVEMRNLCMNGLKVTGGPRAAAGGQTPARVNIFQGGTSRDKGLDNIPAIYDVRKGGRVLVRDIWYEGHGTPLINIDDGEFTYCSGLYAADPEPMRMDKMNGRLMVGQLRGSGTSFVGDPAKLKMLLLGFQLGEKDELKLDIPAEAPIGVLGCRRHIGEEGTATLDNRGRNEPDFVLEMLGPLRAEKPLPVPEAKSGVTRLLLRRVGTSLVIQGGRREP